MIDDDGGGAFVVVRRRSGAGEFHARPVPEPARNEIWVHDITAPALVLGSTQSDDVVDSAACRREGVEVVRRRSGGGAVLLVPEQVVWIDVILPTGGPGWSPDVHRPMVWLGAHLRRAVDGDGTTYAVHDAAMVNTEHSRLVCFDGVGPGELVRSDGAKLVGISQRRTRHAARLQCCWYSEYDPRRLTSLLATGPDPAGLRPVATLSRDRSLAVVDGLAASLSSASH